MARNGQRNGDGLGAHAPAAPARMLTLAAPKGRVLGEMVSLFARAGIPIGEITSETRRLIHAIPAVGLRVLVVRSADVPTYVAHGAADLGVAGSDTIGEGDDEFDLYQPLDLGIGRCRLSVAEPVARPVDERSQIHLRIATKYPNLTQRYLADRGLTAEVIKLNGSIELGPLTGLSDRIVDLVSSGQTLEQNGLCEVETIMQVSSRLVVNRASLKLHGDRIDALIERLAAVLPGADAARPAASKPRASAARPRRTRAEALPSITSVSERRGSGRARR